MWCVHLNLSWQTETILTRSKLSKMHLLLDPLQVRRSTTGTWYSPDQTCKGQFCHGCGLNGVFKGSMFKIRLNDEQNHCFVSYTFAHFFGGKHTEMLQKKPLQPGPLDSRVDETIHFATLRCYTVDWGPWSRLASLSIYESCRQTQPHDTRQSDKFNVDLFWCYVLMMWASPCSVFVMFEGGEWRRTSIVWSLPSS